MTQAGRAATLWRGVRLVACVAVAATVVGAAPAWAAVPPDLSLFVETEPLASDAARGTRRVAVSLRLLGLPAVHDEFVAIVEGTLLARVMVQLTQEPGFPTWQAKLSVEAPAGDAHLMARESRRAFHRLDITVARLRRMSFEPIMTRSAYVGLEPRGERTMEPPPRTDDPPADPTPPSPELPRAEERPAPPGIEREPVQPVTEAIIAETDVPLPAPVARHPDYWDELRRRITHAFAEQVGKSRGAVKGGRLPRVGFRLAWNGMAETIYLERSSGNRALDQAGLESVIEAHPFPPFPASIPDLYRDVHMDFADRPRTPAPPADRAAAAAPGTSRVHRRR